MGEVTSRPLGEYWAEGHQSVKGLMRSSSSISRKMLRYGYQNPCTPFV
jgi:hypothetical protein